MYGKNLTFKTGGVDVCDWDKIMQLISEGKIDTTHLITHRYPLSRIQEAYDLFAKREDGVIKTAIYPDWGYTNFNYFQNGNNWQKFTNSTTENFSVVGKLIPISGASGFVT